MLFTKLYSFRQQCINNWIDITEVHGKYELWNSLVFNFKMLLVNIKFKQVLNIKKLAGWNWSYNRRLFHISRLVNTRHRRTNNVFQIKFSFLEVVYVTIGNPVFCFALLTGVHFEACYSTLVTWVSKKSSVDQSELEK